MIKPVVSWAFLLSGVASLIPAEETDPPRPNILLIVSDDQGYEDLGCYGSREAKTPALDRLAREGARLTSFYAAWPACTPSRVSLLTGRYPQRTGTYDLFRNDRVDDGYRYSEIEYAISPENVLGTDLREVFLSEVLAKAGYVSGCFGKWDCGQLRRFLPLQQGFHDFYGFTSTGIDYWTHERYGVHIMRRGDARSKEDQGTYATDLFRREAVRFLHQNHAHPFFLYVPFNAPHSASSLDPEVRGWVQAPREYVDLYEPGKNSREEKRRHYLAAVTCMDAAIGELLRALDEYDVARRTIVIFLSDNGGGGGSSNAPLRGGKAQMFEGGLRVPCIIRWPGRIEGGTVCDEFLTALEIFPTLLRAVGAEAPLGTVIDGFDMLPVLQGEQSSPRREMFWQRRGDRAARVGSWKWVDSQRGSGLFDLREDAGEERDRAGERPDILEMVQQRFSAWQEDMQAAEPRGPFRDF
ncbi:MAG: sulfatase-like hydrolase/transferase [Planctomycetes bacterium]|nr:sulfatase-like hydrolase/transferase [Planctomycetota bacterium]